MPAILALWEAEAGRSGVQGQPGILSKSEARMSCIARPCLRHKRMKAFNKSMEIREHK